MRSIQEENGHNTNPAPPSLNEEEKCRSEEKYDDEEDTDSLASVAGSERCLLKLSASPPQD